ncbi:outer membrane lipoprotein carrier protein LolA [Heliobacterium chlorum]|uniref:Outer membrane lipoprotein carrier protein LolA n=1 Tax=Heliobacterium chlorum TaxID=2698 RepID=A0ABR7T287_HELCL|nr:DUF4412 domain-containing protein [Heliobacterium chlorum]MBC9784317.1 outer membrane lipoprotein carrier protein LolA [Heliobacterium chlorum]
MKKVFSVLLGTILVATLISGCGGGQQTQPSTQTSSTSHQEAQAPNTSDDLKTLLAKTKDIKTISYTMVMTSDGKELAKSKMWMKGPKLKMEMSDGPMKGIFYVDSDKKVAYTYIPEQNTAMKMDMAQFESKKNKTPLDYGEQLETDETKYSILGDQELRGELCKVIETKDKENVSKLWISKNLGLPIRVESKDNGTLSTIDFIDFETADIPDGQFELPTGVQIVDMNDLMKGMPKASN